MVFQSIHDRDLARTTNGQGNVDELSLAEVQAFNAGEGQRVPTLTEVLGELGGRARLNIEIKQRGIEREVLTILERFPGAEWTISSFDWETLRAVRWRSTAAPLWPLATGFDDHLLDVAKELNLGTTDLHARALTEETSGRIKAAALNVIVWAVNELAEARRMRTLGAAALCSDIPGPIRRGLAGKTDRE